MEKLLTTLLLISFATSITSCGQKEQGTGEKEKSIYHNLETQYTMDFQEATEALVTLRHTRSAELMFEGSLTLRSSRTQSISFTQFSLRRGGSICSFNQYVLNTQHAIQINNSNLFKYFTVRINNEIYTKLLFFKYLSQVPSTDQDMIDIEISLKEQYFGNVVSGTDTSKCLKTFSKKARGICSKKGRKANLPAGRCRLPANQRKNYSKNTLNNFKIQFISKPQ